MTEPLRVAEDGSVTTPAEYLQRIGLGPGDAVVVLAENDELRVFSLATGIRRAQEIVRRYVPAARNLADELIAERHAEAERE